MPKRVDMTGQRFGRLVVIAFSGRDSHRQSLWQVRCDCGQVTICARKRLVAGYTSSCGCLQRELASERKRMDLTGRRFGRLRVIKFAAVINGRLTWECVCDCGNTKTARAGDLRTGSIVSCGCYRIEQSAKGHVRDLVGYTAAHVRVHKLKGKAAAHLCVDCGGQAADWSYDGNDAKQLFAGEHESSCAYSLDPTHYVPRCKTCHSAHDRNARKASA